MSGDVRVLVPLAVPVAGAFAVYLLARLVPRRLRQHTNGLLASFTALILALALGGLAALQSGVSASAHLSWGYLQPNGASLRAEPGALVIIGVALGLGFLVTIYSGRYLVMDQRYETYYPLLLLLIAGLTGMLLSADLFTLYLFCELMSIAAYALVAFRRRTRTAVEAGFKYLVMGSASTVTILLGIAFIYRETGQLALVQSAGRAGPWTRAGIACWLAGLGLKSALAPLHTWLPDAHGRAPSSISAMLSGIVVQSAFYTMVKVCLGLGLPARALGALLLALAVLNMFVGNGLALVQTHTKRLLGYSTIAQMGYLMLAMGIGLRYGIREALQAGLFLIVSQATLKGLAFLSKGVCHFYLGTTTISQLNDTANRMPLVALTFSVALAGLASIPPLAGFTAKWFILTSILRAPSAIGYAGMAALLANSLISLGYYLPMIGALFRPSAHTMASGQSKTRVHVSVWMALPLVILSALVLAVGVFPGPWLAWTFEASQYLLALGR
ncbi:MAG: hypothetical protein GX620_04910 [Chloroflexi bacterium]|nr:hypothetical protein [Chloroflexota bacterium]